MAIGPGAAALTLGSVAMSAFAAHEKGAGQQAADDYQAQRAEEAAQFGQTKAAETDAQTRENLNVTLGNIAAVRAASGVDPSSPTTAALQQRTEYLADRSRSIQVDNILGQSSQDTQDAAYLRSAGSFAMQMGDLNAATGVMSAAAKAAMPA